MKKRRVVVTGIGAVTPLGANFAETWQGIKDGRRQAAPVERFDATQFQTKIAFEVKDFAFRSDVVQTQELIHVSQAAQFGINAALEAWEASGLDKGGADPLRTSVCLGVGMCSPDLRWYEDIYLKKDFDNPVLREHIRFFPDQVSSIVGRIIQAKASISTVHTACASSGQSLGEAFETVAFGDADVILTGGCDSMIHPFYFAGFNLLGALSKRNDEPDAASRPFDKERDGFVLGEGACMLVFEEYEHAKARGANILAEVCGFGVTESAYRITDLHPDGVGPIEAMQMAIDEAGIPPESVGYVNAHGTSTSLNDRIEALAVSKVFPKERCNTLVSSTKSMTGHMISAAGAIEFATCVQALYEQVLPPSVNIFTKDPECLVELTPATATPTALRYALSNSVGFGGSNTALVAGRVEA